MSYHACSLAAVLSTFVAASSFAQVAPSTEDTGQSPSIASLLSQEQTDSTTAAMSPASLATAPTLDGEETGGENLYSSPEMRAEWESMLAQECPGTEGMEVFWDPTMGNLAAFTAQCPMVATDADSTAAWLREHDQMLGLLPGDELLLPEGGTADFVVPIEDGEVVVAGISHNFTVTHEGLPYLDGAILANLSDSDNILFGVANTLAPSVGGFGEHNECSLDDAIAAFRAQLPPDMIPAVVDSKIGWFDPDWATNRRVGVEDIHWRISLASPWGWSGTAYVRCSGMEITFLTQTGGTNYAPRQEHYAHYYVDNNVSGRIAWENYSGNNRDGCSSSSDPYCADPVYSESLVSRDIAARVPATLYDVSASSGWPFTQRITAPPGNIYGEDGLPEIAELFRIAIAADPNVRDVCSGNYPCTPRQEHDVPTFMPRQITFPTVAHEYAHLFIPRGALGNMAYVNNDEYGAVKPLAFTEAICDFFGFVTEQAATGATNFEIRIPSQTHFTDWKKTVPGDCVSYVNARAQLGAALYNAYTSIRSYYALKWMGGAFPAWRTAVAASLKGIPGVPNFVKFYSVATARATGCDFWWGESKPWCVPGHRLQQSLKNFGMATCQ